MHLEKPQHAHGVRRADEQGLPRAAERSSVVNVTDDPFRTVDFTSEVMMAVNRVMVVANRLPITICHGATGVEMVPSSGGLASGLRAWHQRSKAVWVGWPGALVDASLTDGSELEARFSAAGLVPVYLSSSQIDGYYHGLANRVLWPLFHYSMDRVPIGAAGWEQYREVNELFAARVALEYRHGDTIWVHDYHLMLLPALLRHRLPHARIGFFLHVPFPSSEVFRTLPWRSEVLSGLLGADLIGFHTFAYLRHFLSSLLRVEGIESEIDRVRVADREVRLGVFPMGVDAAELSTRAASEDVERECLRIRQDVGDRQIVLGVDRLDYTKGIPRRLTAIERLLDRHPDLRDRIRFVQVAVPSRENIDSYRRFKRQVEEEVGRINGKCGTTASMPVHYLHRSVNEVELAALYRTADVMLVTPLRDGLNLVAKEFVASRLDERGVLLLSEFAGAATELDGAVTVNPYDVDAVADRLHRALSMSIDEQRARMRRLRQQVTQHDVSAWAESFLQCLEAARPRHTGPPAISRPEPALATLLTTTLETSAVRLLLDYDGTLVPIARSPELAAPDDEVLSLLAGLAASADRIRVEIVSGRPRETLEEWFGALPVSLWAEHGFWYRALPGMPWRAAAPIPSDRLRPIGSILQQFARDTPGSQVEVKSASLAWHYRRADRQFGSRQAHELRMLLGDVLSNQPFEVMEGKKVIEVRLRGVSKALVVRRAEQERNPEALLVAIGDDRTDEDLFRELPPGSISIGVGSRLSSARFHLDDYRAVRHLLQALSTGRYHDRRTLRRVAV
jgi:trehalose 6-phosphate synthase/phosphatase